MKVYIVKRWAQTAISIFALSAAFATSIIMLWAWWDAAQNNWVTRVTFNAINEHWAEGVLFHLAIVALLAHSWWFLTERAKQ